MNSSVKTLLLVLSLFATFALGMWVGWDLHRPAETTEAATTPTAATATVASTPEPQQTKSGGFCPTNLTTGNEEMTTDQQATPGCQPATPSTPEPTASNAQQVDPACLKVSQPQ